MGQERQQEGGLQSGESEDPKEKPRGHSLGRATKVEKGHGSVQKSGEFYCLSQGNLQSSGTEEMDSKNSFCGYLPPSPTHQSELLSVGLQSL